MLPCPTVQEVDLVFPSSAPCSDNWVPREVIPHEAWDAGGNIHRSPEHAPRDQENRDKYEWNHSVFVEFFFENRFNDFQAIPKEGVDPENAFRALYCLAACRWLKHEHKEAAWVFAANQWFEGVWLKGMDPPPWLPLEEE